MKVKLVQMVELFTDLVLVQCQIMVIRAVISYNHTLDDGVGGGSSMLQELDATGAAKSIELIGC